MVMDVELYVYDLSGGLARQYSAAITGVQIDAIYHTAVVFGGVEYFFGQGIHRKIPGSTHHGRPMQVVPMGRTDLPMDVIAEYIQSLESIYTTESYDLFVHNCNNFSQDLCMFLVGKSIPENISSLPETFLRTPIGQMMRGQIDQSMRRMTQAPDAASGRSAVRKPPAPQINGHHKAKPRAAAVFINAQPRTEQPSRVHNITTPSELDRLLESAQNSCAVIFFTSATCPPCKIVYPAYDDLAAEAGQKAVLIKIDISKAYELASRYSVRATPTFMTFLRGVKHDEWAGANEPKLRGHVRLLVQTAHPPHPHSPLRLPSLQRIITEPVVYAKSPPLDKLQAKIISTNPSPPALTRLFDFVKTRHADGVIEAPLPDLHFISSYFPTIPPDAQFAFVDLIRLAAVDTRVSAFLATSPALLETLIPPTKDYAVAPYNLQVTTLQLACNLFGSNVFQEALVSHAESSSLPPSPPPLLRRMVENLASTTLLAAKSTTRALAAALVYNLAALDHNERMADPPRPDLVHVDGMGDLEAALVEAVVNESESRETLHGLLLALGLLLYGADVRESSVWDLCEAMDVRESLRSKGKMDVFKGESLLREIGDELLAKGGKT